MRRGHRPRSEKGAVLRPAGHKARRLVAAPRDAIGGVLDLIDLVAVLHQLVAGEIQHPRAAGAERRADREQDRIAEPTADQEHARLQ